jgi:hypothetical protein
MRSVVVLLLALAGCTSPEPGSPTDNWYQTVIEVPRNANEVVKAVAALPECSAVLAGGEIRWRAALSCGSQPFARGCTYIGRKPVLIEVVYAPDAWEAPDMSTLAHELCHVCGYTDGPDAEAQASACAMRAYRQWLNAQR